MVLNSIKNLIINNFSKLCNKYSDILSEFDMRQYQNPTAFQLESTGHLTYFDIWIPGISDRSSPRHPAAPLDAQPREKTSQQALDPGQWHLRNQRTERRSTAYFYC